MMTLSPAGADMIHGDESCRLTAYQDPGGIWTIGWGRAHGVEPGMICTQNQADQWFRKDVANSKGK